MQCNTHKNPPNCLLHFLESVVLSNSVPGIWQGPFTFRYVQERSPPNLSDNNVGSVWKGIFRPLLGPPSLPALSDICQSGKNMGQKMRWSYNLYIGLGPFRFLISKCGWVLRVPFSFTLEKLRHKRHTARLDGWENHAETHLIPLTADAKKK